MHPRLRSLAQRLAAKAYDGADRVLEIRSGDPLAARFAAFGAGSTIAHPRRLLVNPHTISIGAGVTINAGVALEAVHDQQLLIEIGDGSYFGFGVRIVAVNRVVLEREVAIGHGATLADTIHDYKNAKPGQRAWQADLKVGRPLVLEEGVWIGNNAVLAGGFTVGRNAIIGANSSVTGDVPPDSLVLGNPARVVRRKDARGSWEWVVDPASVALLPDLPRDAAG